MKQVIATLRDGSQICHKTVADDFDVEAWAEKRKHNFDMLGIKSIRVELITVENLPTSHSD